MKADPYPEDKPPGAGRPRDPRIDAAILAATADLLVEIGYANITVTFSSVHWSGRPYPD